MRTMRGECPRSLPAPYGDLARRTRPALPCRDRKALPCDRRETRWSDDAIGASFLDVIADIRPQPGLRGRSAAALVDQLPIRSTAASATRWQAASSSCT